MLRYLSTLTGLDKLFSLGGKTIIGSKSSLVLISTTGAGSGKGSDASQTASCFIAVLYLFERNGLCI
jgi:hypothetical protein